MLRKLIDPAMLKNINHGLLWYYIQALLYLLSTFATTFFYFIDHRHAKAQAKWGEIFSEEILCTTIVKSYLKTIEFRFFKKAPLKVNEIFLIEDFVKIVFPS